MSIDLIVQADQRKEAFKIGMTDAYESFPETVSPYVQLGTDYTNSTEEQKYIAADLHFHYLAGYRQGKKDKRFNWIKKITMEDIGVSLGILFIFIIVSAFILAGLLSTTATIH